MAGAHDPGDPGLYSSPNLQVEIRSRERHLSSLASAVASPVTDPTSSARGLASMRHRLSGRAFTNLKQFSVFFVYFLGALQPRRLIRAQSKANFVSYTVQK